MKILTSEQVKALDGFTIVNEPIAPTALMERAATTFVQWFKTNFRDKKRQVSVFCGPGNNGGDGLAIARLLAQDHYEIKAFLLQIGNLLSPDCEANLARLRKERACHLVELHEGCEMPIFPQNSFVIDAIFGAGLNRPIVGFWEKFIQHLNEQPVCRVAVDIPSGMFADRPTTGTSIMADYTFSFEMPKLGFFFPENQERVGEWCVGSIGLHAGFLEKTATPWQLVEAEMLGPILRQRKKYDHKGSFGHALLVAGSYGKVGAAILAARAILRSGAGLVTVHAPKCAYQILQISFPEAMVSVDEHEFVITNVSEDLSRFSAIGIGCGIGTNELTANALDVLLEKATFPLVLDADALNLLAANPVLLQKLPKESILTPHPKEFERLFGKSPDGFSQNELLRKKAQQLGIFIVLKGAHTAIACPDGTCFFNPTGNPGMATGGSGDVLTGMVTGLLTQGYPPRDACLLGVYLHGLAGDLAKVKLEQEALLASDITGHIGQAFITLRGNILTL